MARLARVYGVPPAEQRRLTLVEFRLLQRDYHQLEQQQEGG
jgi:hypothetical protein